MQAPDSSASGKTVYSSIRCNSEYAFCTTEGGLSPIASAAFRNASTPSAFSLERPHSRTYMLNMRSEE